MLVDNHNSKMEYPPLYLVVKYTDIHAKEIEKTFVLHLAWNFMSNPNTKESELAKFRFEIVEANDKISYNSSFKYWWV
ncbi:hypothetical protein [Flavobacterium terrigena]|uniref:Uncharacterized protein n=1 Tax=Flavobacterium terrigena TaxID=402734 RepID=A0A1H6WNK8_9FLAO|nr:hypothetical protein [Flavobacterium terrigena]SEJ14062.1 hypothetical protein SAMN05660918_2509 [Flavobacterium terrigena]